MDDNSAIRTDTRTAADSSLGWCTGNPVHQREILPRRNLVRPQDLQADRQTDNTAAMTAQQRQQHNSNNKQAATDSNSRQTSTTATTDNTNDDNNNNNADTDDMAWEADGTSG